jgi:hypothetical protein
MSLFRTLDKLVPIFFRNTLNNPNHIIHTQPTPIKTLPNPPPLSPTYLYQLGVRTLYLLERSMGLRPYICYVEYKPLVQTTPTTSLPSAPPILATPTGNTFPTQFPSLPFTSTTRNNISPQPSTISFSSNLLSSKHLKQSNPLPHEIIQSKLPKFLFSSPNLLRPKNTPHDTTTTITATTQYIINNIPKRTHPYTKNNIQFNAVKYNRHRTIEKIIPISSSYYSNTPNGVNKIINNPLSPLPAEKQIIFQTMHDFFKQVQIDTGGIPLTPAQKLEILRQLDPEFIEIFSNSFIINYNYRLEERLVQFINKGNFLSIRFQNTIPSLLQRYQLINLLKDLQVIVV